MICFVFSPQIRRCFSSRREYVIDKYVLSSQMSIVERVSLCNSYGSFEDFLSCENELMPEITFECKVWDEWKFGRGKIRFSFHSFPLKWFLFTHIFYLPSSHWKMCFYGNFHFTCQCFWFDFLLLPLPQSFFSPLTLSEIKNLSNFPPGMNFLNMLSFCRELRLVQLRKSSVVLINFTVCARMYEMCLYVNLAGDSQKAGKKGGWNRKKIKMKSLSPLVNFQQCW